jgi:hypothetical protein
VGFLDDLDKIKADLEQRFPSWPIWFVPHIVPVGGCKVTWCARPWPLINSSSPEHLAADIRTAHEEAAAEWPALASLADYGANAPGIPRAKSK